MKKLLLFALLSVGMTAFSQTEAEFCQQAQTQFDLQHYNEAIKAASRALAKNSEAPCRRLRINALMQSSPSSANYIQAITDLEYLSRMGDKSEPTAKQLGEAQMGLAKIYFENKNFKQAENHFMRSREAYQRAKAAGNNSNYDETLANLEINIKQASANSGAK